MSGQTLFVRTLPLIAMNHPESLGSLAVYGSDAAEIRALAEADPELRKQLHPQLPYIAAEVVWAARQEMARTLEDVLAQRTRALFLNAEAAMSMAQEAARILAVELGKDLPGHPSRSLDSRPWLLSIFPLPQPHRQGNGE
jgi:glycerol-3-phosphate dehydrogenase